MEFFLFVIPKEIELNAENGQKSHFFGCEKVQYFSKYRFVWTKNYFLVSFHPFGNF